LLTTIDFTLFAAADFAALPSLVAAVAGVVALMVGIWRLRLRWWLVGGGLLLVALLWAALVSEPVGDAAGDGQSTTLEVLTLRVRPVDAESGKTIGDAVATIVRDDRSPDRPPPQPAVPRATDAELSIASTSADGAIIVSALIEAKVRGTLWAQLRRPRLDMSGYELVVEAPGYQAWRAALNEILHAPLPDPTSPETIEPRLTEADRAAR
jgi:hypothetical protein